MVNLVTHRPDVIDIVVYGNVDEFALLALAEKARDDLLQKPGVTAVEISGVRPREISIPSRPDKSWT